MKLHFKGVIIALDRSAGKLKSLEHNVQRFGLTNVHCYLYDSTVCCRSSNEVSTLINCNLKVVIFIFLLSIIVPGPPPYPPALFDKILLDAPCSGLGQRPSFNFSMSLTDFTSLPPYQKKLLTQVINHN